MHIGIYDFGGNMMYVSNASPSINGTCTPAYLRPFAQLNMTAMWAQAKP
jgi:hypothetical protein